MVLAPLISWLGSLLLGSLGLFLQEASWGKLRVRQKWLYRMLS